MIRLFSPRLTFTTSNTVLKISARSVRLSVLRLGERTGKTPKIKFNIGGVEKLNDPSKARRWLDWMPTKEGRYKMSMYLGTGGAAFITVCSWVVNIFGMEMFIHEYCLPELKPDLKILSSESSQFQPSSELRRVTAVCQTRAGVEVDDLDRLITFHTELLDPVSNGCLLSSQGAAIGLPQHFTADTVDLQDLLVKTGYNRWFKGFRLPDSLSKEDEAELVSCLTLSQEEKEFGVSQSMARVNSWHSVYQLVVPPVLWFLSYCLGHTVNNRLDLFSKPRVFRVMSVCWIGTTTLLSYLYFINASSLETDINSFQLVCRTPEEANIGISYYEKILRRNVLLRRLLGEQMEYYIQESGEYVPLIYEIEDYRNISTKIQSLKDIREDLSKTE